MWSWHDEFRTLNRGLVWVVSVNRAQEAELAFRDSRKLRRGSRETSAAWLPYCMSAKSVGTRCGEHEIGKETLGGRRGEKGESSKAQIQD